MVIPNTGIAEQELRTIEGKVFAYFIPAEEMDRVRAEMEALREQVATLQRQKARYVAELAEVLKTYIPIPPTEEELKSTKPNSEAIARLIADLESR